MEKLNPSCIAGGNGKWPTSLENSLAVSLKANHRTILNPAIVFLGFSPREVKTYVHTKSWTQTNVCSSFIRHRQKLGSNPDDLRGWMVKQTVVHPYYTRNTSQREREELLTHTTTWLHLQDAGGQKASPKGHILYDPIYMAFVKWQNYRQGEQHGGCRGQGGGRGVGVAIKRQHETSSWWWNVLDLD